MIAAYVCEFSSCRQLGIPNATPFVPPVLAGMCSADQNGVHFNGEIGEARLHDGPRRRALRYEFGEDMIEHMAIIEIAQIDRHLDAMLGQ